MTKAAAHGPKKFWLDCRLSGGHWAEPRLGPRVGLPGDQTWWQPLIRAVPSNTSTVGTCANVCKMPPRHTDVEPRATELQKSLEEGHPLRKSPEGL